MTMGAWNLLALTRPDTTGKRQRTLQALALLGTLTILILSTRRLELLGFIALCAGILAYRLRRHYTPWRALGGALGGYIAGPQAVVDLLRQRARPYLFSNALPPAVVGAALAALDIVEAADGLRAQLFDNARYWRAGLESAGFRLLPGEHPIVPVMLAEAKLAQAMAADLARRGVHVAGFFFPVVPQGQARIRTQMNARLTRDDLDFALDAFTAAGRAVGVI